MDASLPEHTRKRPPELVPSYDFLLFRSDPARCALWLTF